MNSVYALALSRVNVETVELDVLITHIFKTLASKSGNFDVVIDCTGFTMTSEIPLLWLKVFLERCPLEFVQGFSRAFLLNVNNAAAKFLRKLYHISAGNPLAKSSISVSSIEDLKNHLPAATAEALTHTTLLERERAVVYNQVAQQSRHGMRLPVSLTICETHIRILSVRLELSPRLPLT
jgi:neurofibromin 1